MSPFGDLGGPHEHDKLLKDVLTQMKFDTSPGATRQICIYACQLLHNLTSMVRFDDEVLASAFLEDVQVACESERNNLDGVFRKICEFLQSDI